MFVVNEIRNTQTRKQDVLILLQSHHQNINNK